MKRLAIFGAHGYLGRQLAHYFAEKKYAVTTYDLPGCDITRNEFWDAFDPKEFEAIHFFSGVTGTERGFFDAHRYLSANEQGLINLLMKLAPLGTAAPKVIFPSTRLVYKGSDYPLAEGADKEVKTVYAVNKLACEGYLAAYSNRFGIPYAVMRICVPYGNIVSSDYSYGTLGFFLNQVAAHKSIALFGGGVVRRTFTHVTDICQVAEFLANASAVGIFNVGGDNYSLAEAADFIARKKGGRVESVPWPAEALALETGSTVFDSSKLDSLMHLRYCHLTDCRF